MALPRIDLASDHLRDQIYGCWMGKNCGGTLGGPLEKVIGEPEPFDVWWYPKLQEGGIPNDDLEMQLVWLKCLEEVGPQMTAADLSRYWLDHIGYNWDEYGLSRTNLRLGMLPPVSGAYNNWFKDCMGCPIRSEIWACVAPGFPRIAARYAYEDGIQDHAGGESVYGEVFNAALEAAAFVVSDREQLLDIGMSYLVDGSKTAAAIRAARDAHRAGVDDWKEARRRVMKAAPHYNAQYSPINLGFQVVGWLYGDDFGDTLCK
ncbi:MAG TPA: ADP-ribosylglycohydrolase family protein, partial [Tepidisphaeraceae bacterium]|nr:ADP-ribosylglycohydrolase family protein [Tepidisphaeraceae bacterium]